MESLAIIATCVVAPTMLFNFLKWKNGCSVCNRVGTLPLCNCHVPSTCNDCEKAYQEHGHLYCSFHEPDDDIGS